MFFSFQRVVTQGSPADVAELCFSQEENEHFMVKQALMLIVTLEQLVSGQFFDMRMALVAG